MTKKPEYTPLKTAKKFHDDTDSLVKYIVGGVGVGTTTAVVMEMMAKSVVHHDNLLVVDRLFEYRHSLEHTLRHWTQFIDTRFGLNEEGSTYEIYLGTARWRVIMANDLDYHFSKVTDYDNVAVSGVHPDHDFSRLLIQLSRNCKNGQVFGECKPAAALENLRAVAIHQFPPAMIEHEGTTIVNPELETWHMPRGPDWFQDFHDARNKS